MMFLAERAERNDQPHSTKNTPKKRGVVGTEFAEDASLAFDSDSTILHLPLTVILTHPIALSHFIEFLGQIGGQNYIDFYLAIEVRILLELGSHFPSFHLQCFFIRASKVQWITKSGCWPQVMHWIPMRAKLLEKR
jgi:hypothetical protein